MAVIIVPALAANIVAKVAKMDEDEINNWYEEQKQAWLDNYVKDLENGLDKIAAEKKYRAALEKILQRYHKLMDENLTSAQKKKVTALYRKSHPTMVDKFMQKLKEKKQHEKQE